MSYVPLAVEPGDRWNTLTIGQMEMFIDTYSLGKCESPRHEGKNLLATTVQVFTRVNTVVAVYGTCDECNELMHSAV